MIVRLSKKQERALLEWSGRITAAHHEDGTLAPGYDLVISISPFGDFAEARCDSDTLDLGDVEVVFD